MVDTTPIGEKRFAELAGSLVGLPISTVWLGDYTALYLEIGPLVDVYPDSGRPKAQHTAYLGFHWVLESDAGQELSSTDAGRQHESGVLSPATRSRPSSSPGPASLSLRSRHSGASVPSLASPRSQSGRSISRPGRASPSKRGPWSSNRVPHNTGLQLTPASQA